MHEKRSVKRGKYVAHNHTRSQQQTRICGRVDLADPCFPKPLCMGLASYMWIYQVARR